MCMEIYVSKFYLSDHKGSYRFQIRFESTKERLESILVFNSDSGSK